ncbi:DNA-binding domain-containing protein [soil metagenome]
MPPSALRELQAAFAAHLLGEEQPGLVAQIAGGAIPAAARLRVHRHHVVDSLSAALAATFPTVQALVGADFFGGLARAFIARALPAQPVLSEYGAGFPAFLADHAAAADLPHLADLPYLADVARLDWALNLAFQAAPGERLVAADLAVRPAAELPSLRLALAPGSLLIVSAHPLDRIWQASQPGAGEGTVDLSQGGAQLLVLRRAEAAAFTPLSTGEAAFIAALAGGRTSLEEAAHAGATAEAAFDLSASFARLLALGAFAALQ